MALIVMLSVVALLPVSGATSGCVGKCFPGSNDQYQGKLVALSNEISDTHEPSSLDILSYFAYEKTGQKFYGNGTKFDSEGDYQRTQMLQLNDAHPPVQYVIINGNCTVDKPGMVGVVCVPKSAKKLGTMTLGSPKNSLQTDVYVSNVPWDGQTGDKKDATIHVLTPDCYPVFFAMEGIDPDGNDRIVSTLLGNYENKIDNPSVFDIPKGCKQ